ncbi:4014_t:CDS:1, partial [Dentiscutata heterogama]
SISFLHRQSSTSQQLKFLHLKKLTIIFPMKIFYPIILKKDAVIDLSNPAFVGDNNSFIENQNM